MLKIIREAVETITGCDTNKVTRVREYVQARAMYYHFARKSGATLTAIGQSNGKDTLQLSTGLRRSKSTTITMSYLESNTDSFKNYLSIYISIKKTPLQRTSQRL